MVNYEAIYPGATYLLDPNYNFIGYRIPVGELGATTSIQSANQLKEVTNLLNQGMVTTELSLIDPSVFEMIPKQHLKEIQRLNKLTGAETTLHAPTMDPSGFTQQGWSEENREATERQFTEFVKRSQELSPEGNIPVTIHASVVPGSEIIPETHRLVTPEEKGKGPVLGRMIAVDQETGQFVPLEREKLYAPEYPKGKIKTPEERLDMANYTRWTDGITNLAFYKKQADEFIGQGQAELQPFLEKLERKEELTEEEIQRYSPQLQQLEKGKLFLDNVQASFRTFFEQAAKYPGGDEKSKETTIKILNNISKDWKKFGEEAEKEGLTPPQFIIKQSNLLDNSISKLRILGSGKGAPEAPQKFKPIEDFTKDKASETLSNVALNSYKKFGEKSPIISIENPPYGTALSSGEELKSLIKETRRKFEDKLVRQGKSKGEAERAAERLIGATWDTSHISMIRNQGFGPEKIVEETKAIAPFVKHVHFNDNFGSTHTDLPPGMGTVPLPKVLKELEKAKYKGKKVSEMGGFVQHFQTSPFAYQLESVSSPVFTSPGLYWNQLGIPGAYYGGQGPINPPIHHSLYRAGFTNLPVELGGEMPGLERGRMAQAA